VRGAKYVRDAFHVLRRQFKPGGVILLYHRVIGLRQDLLNLAVPPQRFAQQLQHIRRTCEPMRLSDLVQALQQRSLPRRAVAITFDDGYADNFMHAYPLLESAGIPATVFVAAGQIDTKSEFWWDDLERILLQSNHLPDHLRIEIRGREQKWQLESLEHRERVYHDLRGLLRTLDGSERSEALARLASWAGLERAGRADYRAVTTDELVELAQSKLIDIGAHTMTHPVLSALAPDAQTAEIVSGREKLESIIGSPISTFAYPYGEIQDFTDETVAIVRAAGLSAACTTVHGSIESGDDLFRLRRFAVFDWDMETFARRLESSFVDRE
jgi:peptidoglycan/xylan/chitin deacetylase (PgdA/CDA1 family)